MLGLTRWNPFDDIFNMHRSLDRMIDQFWSELPSRTAAVTSAGFRVKTSEDGWKLELPIAGIDPKNVTVEASEHGVTVRAVEPAESEGAARMRYEQSLTLPQFLDLDQMTAAYRHGVLELSLPVKAGEKPRRIEIQGIENTQKRIAAAA
jgi:HSP20 family protein